MKLSMSIEDNKGINSGKSLQNLHSFLKRNVDGEIDFERSAINEGEMSTGAIIGLSAILESFQTPLVELIKALGNYADIFKSEVSLKTSDGAEITIKSSKLTKENIQQMVELISNSK